ncbi:MAG: nucleotide exchange factor GrpE [Sphingomonadaceae bacterium]
MPEEAQASDLREETAEDAPELAEHDRVAELEAALAAAKQEALYAHAETENVRRRLERDAKDARSYAATGFARDMLSVADNLQRALEAIPEEVRDEQKWKGLITGIQATGRELEAVFKKHGIERIAAMGLELDPNFHLAMMEVPSSEAEPGTIVQEMQAGYTINGRLLRPALVGVAKKAE